MKLDCPVYLDYNATTPVDDRVVEKICWALKHCWYNPSSTYAKRSTDELVNAENIVKKFLWPNEATSAGRFKKVIFTSGATESNFTVIHAVISKYKKPLIVTSKIEHASLLSAIEKFEKMGLIDVCWIPVTPEGLLDVSRLTELIDRTNVVKYDVVLGCLMLANNETGVIQPLSEFCTVLKSKASKCIIHSDMSQVIGKIKVDLNCFDIDTISLTGHKFYAPKGIGCLVINGDNAKELLSSNPLFCGGGQQNGYRSGTECVPLILGLAEAFVQLSAQFDAMVLKMREQRDRLEKALVDSAINAIVVGANVERLPNTSMILGVMNLLDENVLVTRGCGAACHSKPKSCSHVLQAMGLNDLKPVTEGNIVRISTGKFTTDAEIDQIIRQISSK